MIDWATVLKIYRKQNRLLQKQAAFDLGVDVVTLSRWERGISEPNKASKARLYDLLLMGGDPSDLPVVKQQATLGGSVAIINMATGLYIHTHDPQNLTGHGTENLVGQCSTKFIKTEHARQSFEEINGFLGMQRSGVISYSLQLGVDERFPEKDIETQAVMHRQTGFQPVIVIHRRLIDKQGNLDPAESVQFLTEDDLPAL